MAASGAGVEGKVSRGELAGSRGRGEREELTEVFESAKENGGGGARGAGEGGLIDELHAGKFVESGDLGGGRFFVGDDAKMAGKVVVDDGVGERGFPGSGNAGEGDEDAEGDFDVEVFDIVDRGAGDGEVGLGLAVGFGNGDGFGAVEVGEGLGCGVFFLGLALGKRRHDGASGFAGGGAHVDEVVGLVHDRFIVFDDADGDPFVAQGVHHLGEAMNVAVVQADGRFVEDEESVGESGAEAGGEIHTGDLAAGEGAGGAVESEVAEADFGEVIEARGHFVEDELGRLVERGVGLGYLLKEVDKLVDGEVPKGREGFVEDLEMEGVGLEAGALAVGAGGVGAVAGEKDADVHLVGFCFEPVEEALNTIPTFFGPKLLGLFERGKGRERGAFAVLDPVLLLGSEFVPGRFGIELDFPAGAEEVALAVFAPFALEGLDGALLDREKVVGNGFVEIDTDDATEAPAGGAGPEGGVKAEERGGGLAEGGPGGVEFGELEFWVGNLATSLAETEGVFEGFGEAGFVARGDFDAVLDDVDFPGKFFECGDGVGAEHFLVEEDAEVALGIEEGEELFGCGVFGDRNGEDDEDGFVAQVGLAPLKDGGRRVGLDRLAGAGVVARGEARVEELEVVVNLGEGADGRASGADGVFLLDGDGGRDAVDAIDLGLVHAVKELTDVGREGLDVAALALGVEGVKGEGGFSAAGRAGDDGELADGDVEIEVL